MDASDTDYRIAYQKAVKLLARREHSEAELRRKLSANGDVLDAVMTQLQEQGYQSDARYAEMAARSQMQRGHGPLRIRMALQQSGVHGDLINDALAALDCEWSSLARRVREKRFGAWLNDADRKERARQMRFLAGRGFSGDHIDAAFSHCDVEDSGF